VRPVGVVHWCQPGRGWVTFQPGDCLTWWQARLRAPALQAQVRRPCDSSPRATPIGPPRSG